MVLSEVLQVTVAKKETGTLLLVFIVFSQLTQPLVSDFKVLRLSPRVVSAFCWFHNLIQEAKEQLLQSAQVRGSSLQHQSHSDELAPL